MTTRTAGDEHGRPVDMTTLHEDDLLLDRLGRGEDPADGDAVASALSRWRAALPPGGRTEPVDDELVEAALAVLRPQRRFSRVARRSAALSAMAVLAFGTVAAASEHAGPDSPLWPLTQLMFHDRAEARVAADTAGDSLSAARTAIDGGRYDQAARMLDDAAAAVERIGGGADAERLRDEIAALRALLPAEAGGPTAGPPARVPASEVPGPDVPGADLPGADVPGTDVPGSGVPGTVVPSPRVDLPSPAPPVPSGGPTGAPPVQVPPVVPSGVGVPPLVSVGPLLPPGKLAIPGGLIGPTS